MVSTAPEYIRLHGVRQNNLQGFDLDLPLGKLIVVTGLSGAGKSSLVFETLHAEGQRRYVETFSPYTRQFMDMLDPPKVDRIENIRPSIAIEQSNTVRTSRSTVGTMTELTDFFKVWFSHVATLFDPETGEPIEDDNPHTVWKKALRDHPGKTVTIAFRVDRAGKLTWGEIIQSLQTQGYIRAIRGQAVVRLEELDAETLSDDPLFVVQDRIALQADNQNRFLEAARAVFHFGKGQLHLFDHDSARVGHYSEGLHSPGSDRRYRPATPGLFSYNSPLGACPRCRGFGRVIEIDDRLVIPDRTLSLAEGAIKAFSGEVYSESQRDLMRACRQAGIRTQTPFRDLNKEEQHFVFEGEPGYGEEGREWPDAWYGLRRFFQWLQSNTYKMHVRVFLSKYRAYTPCPECHGARLQPEALNWRWRDLRLPDLYHLAVQDLHALMREHSATTGDHRVDIATDSILTRLDYLEKVGLGYLTLNRTSRSLSGGETERVNLTSCLGTALVDTLFVLDEPSIGLHARDIDRLIGILRNLTDQGNTVVVVEHDEAIMGAADHLIEIGPQPGAGGGQIVFSGTLPAMRQAGESITGQYLAGKRTIPLPEARRDVRLPRKRPTRRDTPCLRIRDARKHNLTGLDLDLPLNRFVCLTGVSGSGKSTLLSHVIHQGILAERGRPTDDPATIELLECQAEIGEVVLVDQAPVSRTPRSNAVLFVDAWDPVRQLFARTEAAQATGLTTSFFSFNSGDGRCPTCGGLGYERVEMQFMADVFIVCPTCEGERFRPEILEIRWHDHSVADILRMTVDQALPVFAGIHRICSRLESLAEVGLGYLPLGQPLNTLSGGESQRLKLVKYLTRVGRDEKPALLLLDEPTTGLHRDDVRRLVGLLQKLVDQGHSLVVIEHQLDVVKSADWVIELGPGAGDAGGQVVFAGQPEQLLESCTETAPFLSALFAESPAEANGNGIGTTVAFAAPGPGHGEEPGALAVAEAPASYGHERNGVAATELTIVGAREHNLRNLTISIPHREITVVTGVSGSGKSSLAFDIIFAEGQRRFMESMSAWARQFVEQLPRPDIDRLTGIPPTVAIEQRVTHGTRKSTVATITEVAQYFRLLYARAGVQHSPVSGEPLVAMDPLALRRRLEAVLADQEEKRVPRLYLCSPLIRRRKGHHQPIASWAADHGYAHVRADGILVRTDRFQKLDRYKEHDVEAVVATFTIGKGPAMLYCGGYRVDTDERALPDLDDILEAALRLGKSACFLATPTGEIVSWFSTRKTDPVTGEAFPELDPKHFSWNSAQGWCPTCRGYGRLFEWMNQAEDYALDDIDFDDGERCPACSGDRLNPVSRSVRLPIDDGRSLSLPDLLRLTPSAALEAVDHAKLDPRGSAILAEILPEVRERLRFMDTVGLNYLTLDRATATLSGGEAQRIRLAAQLGSNLSGVLYVLDEPSIGLHARDNERLLQSLETLRDKGNTLLVVEHDDDTMRRSDHIIDLGPGAGKHGGHLLAAGPWEEISRDPRSLTGQYLGKGIAHPLRGAYRALPHKWTPRSRKDNDAWLVARSVALRNLKGDDVRIPHARLVVFCGISGAGKSTLARDLLRPTVAHASKRGYRKATGVELMQEGAIRTDDGKPPLKDLFGGHVFRQVIEVDQSPIGKTPRSTPATYIGAFDIIRKFFGSLPDAQIQGFTASSFSFNTKGGRCEKCKGAGRIKLEMNFMPDTYIPCDDCLGRRYGPEILEVEWNGKNIADVLEMSFEESAAFFSFQSRLSDILKLMAETGLGYLALGQSSPTLSGGEAQRLKLVSELARGIDTWKDKKRGVTKRNLYLLEEPTIGLHLSDCEKLIELLHRLVDQGNSVIVIEHHLDIIAEADYVVEIGPEGGDRGGEIIYQGNVAGLLKNPRSATAPFLREKLGNAQPAGA